MKISKLIAWEYLAEEQDYLGETFNCEFVKNQYAPSRRWSRSVLTIFKANSRYYGFEWEEGLTEMQESEIFADEDKMVECFPVECLSQTVYIETYYKSENQDED